MIEQKKRIVFITGTRAEFGKLKPLMKIVEESKGYELLVFVCGMHLSERLGNTYEEVLKEEYRDVYVAYGLEQSISQCANFADTIKIFSGYVSKKKPDLIVVHGDRPDALAGAIVGAMHNIHVAHIEGGEVTGTLDESIRHAISKLAHIHLVCNEEARRRLIQLGEDEKRINIIGSPDIDVMLSEDLPKLEEAKNRYDISYEKYGILIYHPVTTEYDMLSNKIREVVKAVVESDCNYIVIYPNNDLGSEIVLNEYKKLDNNPRFRIYPSLRFEYFLTLLKNSSFIIGNSSVGIREAGIYGIPAIDIGTRQSGRYDSTMVENIVHVNEDCSEIIDSIRKCRLKYNPKFLYGDGNSALRFERLLKSEAFWKASLQKRFVDM